MMRSILLLTTSAAMASASSSKITVANAPSPSSAPSNHQHQRFQQQSRQHEQETQLLWYPSFSSAASSRDEGGTCITSPLSAISAHFAIPGVDYDFDVVDDDDDSVNVEIMASSTKEGCCAAWFPDQDGCACSGDCHSQQQQQQQQWEEDGDDNDVVLWDEHDWQLWNDAAAAAAAAFENQEEEEEEFFYPVFREAYEDSGCAKAVINNDDEDDDQFLTEGGRPLHSSWLHPSRADCCREWFGEQESQSCYLTDLNNLGEAGRSSVKLNEGVNVTMTAGKAVVC